NVHVSDSTVLSSILLKSLVMAPFYREPQPCAISYASAKLYAEHRNMPLPGPGVGRHQCECIEQRHDGINFCSPGCFLRDNRRVAARLNRCIGDAPLHVWLGSRRERRHLQGWCGGQSMADQTPVWPDADDRLHWYASLRKRFACGRCASRINPDRNHQPSVDD